MAFSGGNAFGFLYAVAPHAANPRCIGSCFYHRVLFCIDARVAVDTLYLCGALAAAFGSTRISGETFSTVVRTGLKGGELWNSASALIEASALARTVREDLEFREAGKMAYMVMATAREAYRMLEQNLRLAHDEVRKNMDETFI